MMCCVALGYYKAIPGQGSLDVVMGELSGEIKLLRCRGDPPGRPLEFGDVSMHNSKKGRQKIVGAIS